MKKIIRIFSIILLYFLIITISLELGLRMFFSFTKKDINVYRPSWYSKVKYTADRSRFMSHPFLPFMSRPFDERTIKIFRTKLNKTLEYHYINNSLGFRTPERPYEKKSNVKRIITLGGSTTWDGPTNELTWPYILEQKLNEYYAPSGKQIEVINLAVDSGTAQMSLLILQLFGVHFHPDLVISYDGVNDEFFNSSCSDILPDYSNYLKPFNDRVFSVKLLLPKKAFDSYAVTMISTLFDRYLGGAEYLPDQIWQYTPTTSDKTFYNGTPLFQNAMRLMRSVCREYQCAFVTSIPHWAETTMNIINNDYYVRQFFNQENFNYLDLQKILPHNDYSIHSDEVHWTENGLHLVADAWMKKIVSENLLSLESSPSAGIVN